jgi:hypothetical protein
MGQKVGTVKLALTQGLPETTFKVMVRLQSPLRLRIFFQTIQVLGEQSSPWLQTEAPNPRIHIPWLLAFKTSRKISLPLPIFPFREILIIF